MVRRFASQVHKQASRLLRQNYIKKEPAWFQAVLEHPPLPPPPKSPPPRTSYDLQQSNTSSSRLASVAKHSIAQNPQPKPIQYVEDEIRKQFFQDHPFEAFRAKSLLEGATIELEHPIRGEEWKRLRQRGRNPTPEDAIQYALTLHEHHQVPLTNAYEAAVAQFRSLRAEHDIARKVALMEAESYGIEFGPTQVQITYDKEGKALDSWQKGPELDASELAARKRWKAIVTREGSPGTWSRGQEYVRLWKEGVRPTYSPILEVPSIKPEGLSQPTTSANPTPREISQQADFMQLIPKQPSS